MTPVRNFSKQNNKGCRNGKGWENIYHANIKLKSRSHSVNSSSSRIRKEGNQQGQRNITQ